MTPLSKIVGLVTIVLVSSGSSILLPGAADSPNNLSDFSSSVDRTTKSARFGLPDIIRQAPKDLPIPSSSSILKGDPPLTTSLEDVRLEAPILDGENFGKPQSLKQLPRDSSRGYLAPPGIYEISLQSYCLKPGTHEPGGGDGYAYAALAGARADIITKILRQAPNYPDISQQQIQMLLWGIIAQTRVSDMNAELQYVAKQLLSDSEIKEINGGAFEQIPDSVKRRILAKLPSQLRQILAAEAEIRNRIGQANTTYAELENIAVLTGAVSRGKDSWEIASGRWSLHPDGYFVRYFPLGYRRTRVEALVPRPAIVTRDNLDRITSVEYEDGYRLETEYDDDIGAISVPGEPEMEIYYFSAVRLVSPNRSVVVRDHGWTFVGSPTTGEADFDQLAGVKGAQKRSWMVASMLTKQELPFLGLTGTENFASSTSIQLAQRRNIDWYEANQRYQDAKAKKEKFETTVERLDEPTREEGEQILDHDHYNDGVEAVMENDPEAKGEWLGEHFQRAQQAWAYATCKIANLGTSRKCGDPEPDEPDPDEPMPEPDDPAPEPTPRTPVNPGGDGAIPGNTSRQRLGISGRPF